MNNAYLPQIKICGLTVPEEAKAIADMGADAIGLVFYPKSPRNVSLEQAATITSILPDHVAATGVFVNPDLQFLLEAIERCKLDIAQLHGNESPQFIHDLREATKAGIIKVLFSKKDPKLTDAEKYNVDSFLVECGKGKLPGGNAMAWDWGSAKAFATRYPTALAGGLAPDNVKEAISACLPHAVDASSGLEAMPGRKDLIKAELFINEVRQTPSLYQDQNRRVEPVFKSL